MAREMYSFGSLQPFHILSLVDFISIRGTFFEAISQHPGTLWESIWSINCKMYSILQQRSVHFWAVGTWIEFDNAFDAVITETASVKDDPIKNTPAKPTRVKATTARRVSLAAYRAGVKLVLLGTAIDTQQSRPSGRVSRGSFRGSSLRSSQDSLVG